METKIKREGESEQKQDLKFKNRPLQFATTIKNVNLNHPAYPDIQVLFPETRWATARRNRRSDPSQCSVQRPQKIQQEYPRDQSAHTNPPETPPHTMPPPCSHSNKQTATITKTSIHSPTTTYPSSGRNFTSATSCMFTSTSPCRRRRSGTASSSVGLAPGTSAGAGTWEGWTKGLSGWPGGLDAFCHPFSA